MDEYRLLQRLQATLTIRPPYCSGILEVSHEAFKLYYDGRKNARFIDLLETSTPKDTSDLEALANACERAKLGRGDETVLDETYRKAGKMDADSFMTGLDLEATGLRDAVQVGLLPDKNETRGVRAELYKLNVYGEGAFFKPHKDTPRSQSMFGSLVVVFPTAHQGGALVLRHNDDQFTFDAAALLAGRTSSIAYVAFYSDVKHEVAPVLSGHRLTLTYNLYYETRTRTNTRAVPPSGLEVLQPLHANAFAIKVALAALLSEATFMPRGGTLGFGLRHAYPLPEVWTRDMENPLKSLRASLKGSDMTLFAACTELGVKPRLQLVCTGLENEILLDEMLELGEGIMSVERVLVACGGVRVRDSSTFTGDAQNPWKRVLHDSEDGAGLAVHWLTGASSTDGPRSTYVAYLEEEPSDRLDWLCTSVCLLVDIGPYGDRSGARGDA